jgi:C4-dicarboxylate transporter DctM subunit
MICCCAIGFHTPPLGENIFIAAGVSNSTVEEVSMRTMPFTAVAIIAVFIIAYVPQLTLALPALVGY